MGLLQPKQTQQAQLNTQEDVQPEKVHFSDIGFETLSDGFTHLKLQLICKKLTNNSWECTLAGWPPSPRNTEE